MAQVPIPVPKIQNCWEAKRCHHKEKCPAYHEKKLHGVHDGINAGRACWVVAGTRCGGTIQGEFAQKVGSCMRCEFYLRVDRELRESQKFLKNGTFLLAVLRGEAKL